MTVHSEAEVKQRLADAVSNQSLAQTAQNLSQETLSDRSKTIVEEAITVCKEISAQIELERIAFLERIAEQGIGFEIDEGPIEERTLQYHSFTVKVERKRFVDVVHLASKLRFEMPAQLNTSQLDALSRIAEDVTLVRADASTTRLRIEFLSPPAWSLPKALTPELADYTILTLPPALAPMYGLLRPIRMMAQKLFGRRKPFGDTEFLRTPPGVLPKLFEVAHLIFRDRFIDLGCGDGRVAIGAAEQIGCPAHGVEANRSLYEVAKKHAAVSDAEERIRIVHGDIFDHDIHDFTVIFTFLPASILIPLLKSIKPRIDAQARIVCHEQAALRQAGIKANPLPVFSRNGITVASVIRAGDL